MITHQGVSAFAAASVLVGALIQQAPPATAVECRHADEPAALLAEVAEFIGHDIDPGDAGPGSADTAELCAVAAAELQPANASVGNDHYTVLKVLAGTTKSGNGDAFVDAFLSRLGPRRPQRHRRPGRADGTVLRHADR